MFQLANDLLRPDGSLPRFGDNSPDHTAEDLWGLMMAAHHCGLLATRPRHDVITPLTLMYCGKAPRATEASRISAGRFYPQGGFMFLRSSDGAVELTVHADPRPEARAHGDSGRGSFELWWRGQMIVREPGSILSSSNPRSSWSRSGSAQNVTCLNGLGPEFLRKTGNSSLRATRTKAARGSNMPATARSLFVGMDSNVSGKELCSGEPGI